MINMLLIGIIILLLAICIFLVILLMKKKSTNQTNKSDLIKEDFSKDEKKLIFPKKIEEMGYHSLVKSCVIIFDSFKALNYSKKNEKILSNVEWHSWQISLLLSLLQRDGDLFVPDIKSIIHQSIIDRSLNYLESEIKKIENKYYENVNISKSRDDLSKDVIWTVKEVSIIFYYMSLVKTK